MGLLDAEEVQSGLLVMRLTGAGEGRTVSLEGELELANSAIAEAGLREAMEGDGQVVVDMRELSFIDCAGIALLVRLLRESDRLRFLPSEFLAVTRVLRLTGVDQKLKRAGSPSAEAQRSSLRVAEGSNGRAHAGVPPGSR